MEVKEVLKIGSTHKGYVVLGAAFRAYFSEKKTWFVTVMGATEVEVVRLSKLLPKAHREVVRNRFFAALHSLWLKLKHKHSLCKEWDDNFFLFAEWAIKKGYRTKRVLRRWNIDLPHSEKNTRIVRERPPLKPKLNVDKVNRLIGIMLGQKANQ